ncbi:MAG: LysM peptidoglycan-binding domain-containing protein [Planctomycetota bacterium]|jgi:nucleoid-associated protein YgaU
MKRLTVWMTVAGIVALNTAGCEASKEEELQFFRKQNQQLTQRVAELDAQLESVRKTNQRLTRSVAELEGQLRQAEASVPAAQTDSQPSTADTQPAAAESFYTVVEGDSLWNIAEVQLGDGNRYTEILTLNPRIEEDQPLFVGTKLKMPPQ